MRVPIQFDDAEFMRVLLEDINSDLNEITMIKNHLIVENDIDKSKLIVSKEYKKIFLKRKFYYK